MRLFDDLEALPEFILRFGECYGPTTEAHIDGLQMAALTLVGCLVGPRADVREVSGRRVRIGPLCWNTLIAAPSGLGRKSTTAGTAIDLARSATARWRAQADEDEEERKDDDPVDPREELFLLPGGIGSSGESLTDAVAPPNPATSLMWARDGPPSTLITLDEAGPLFAPSRQRGPHHESMRRFLLETYGGSQTGRRTVRGGVVLGGPCAVASIGTVTTAELLECLSADAVTSGLLGRIVAVTVPPIELDQLQPFWLEPEAEHVGALERWIVAAATVERWRLRLSEEAERVWRDWYTRMWVHYSNGNGNGDHERMEVEATVLSRYQNLAQRLAAAITVAGWAPAPWPYIPGREWRRRPPHAPQELQVSATTMRACCACVQEMAAGVAALVDEAGERSDGQGRYQADARRCLAANPGRRFTRQELGELVRPRRYGIDARAALFLLEELYSSGLIGMEREQTTGRPRIVLWSEES